VYEQAVGFRHLATYSHPGCVSIQLVPGALSLLTAQAYRTRGEQGQRIQVPDSPVLGAPQRIAENGVETNVRSPQDGGQGHSRTESPALSQSKSASSVPYNSKRLKPESSFFARPSRLGALYIV
jgi:hypothetical protein